MTERQETLTQYVGDMLSLTRHIHQAVERQKNDERAKNDRDAGPLITRIDQTLEMHISRLEDHLRALGGDPTSPIKEAFSSLAGVAAGLYDKVRTDPVSKMLRDDYTALSLASMAQTMLHTTGLALKSQATAELALQALKDLTPLVVDISQVIPRVTVKELTDAGEVVDTSVAQQAINNTQFAWSRQVTGK
ncbi:MAG: hypothetical protein OHK0022_55590 [Roseiflexaceae bacterium]